MKKKIILYNLKVFFILGLYDFKKMISRTTRKPLFKWKLIFQISYSKVIFLLIVHFESYFWFLNYTIEKLCYL